jgi:hypothetical protein
MMFQGCTYSTYVPTVQLIWAGVVGVQKISTREKIVGETFIEMNHMMIIIVDDEWLY